MGKSFYEIGGVVLDGSYGFDYRKFKRVRRLYKQQKVGLATAIVVDHVVNILPDVEGIPYSEMQLSAREWAKRNKAKWRRTLAPLPLPPVIKAPLMVVPSAVDAWSRATGSYDMATPEVRRYEESVTWGGSGGQVI